ncbi:hypothetical protein C8R47DRAFT_1079889 [Mycena vitilis]|nr:hypothetical protein C8R47DRAFT_1079889 [Mycena vitilis]
MSNPKKREASESLDPPATRPCGNDLREPEAGGGEGVWAHWDAAMEDLRDFYHLDDTIPWVFSSLLTWPTDKLDSPPSDVVAVEQYRLRGLLTAFSHTDSTDGECIESAWAMMGPHNTTTRQMGPGARHNAVDDLFSAKHLERFDSRPWTTAEVELLKSGRDATFLKGESKVKIFPLGAREAAVKIEGGDGDALTGTFFFWGVYLRAHRLTAHTELV